MAKPKNILLADSSKTFVTFMTYLLRKMGFNKIIMAENGREAARILKLWTPDVVILDVSMPEMDGVEVLKEIRADRRTSPLPVVMVAGAGEQGREEECRKLMCDGFLTKPISVSFLHDVLQECVAKSGVNKRVHLRTAFKREVAVSFEGKTDVQRAETLSEGGIYVRQDPPLPVGTEVGVLFSIDKEKVLRLKGSVIYMKDSEDDPLPLPIGMAVQFIGLSVDEQRVLSDYVTSLITGKPGPHVEG